MDSYFQPRSSSGKQVVKEQQALSLHQLEQNVHSEEESMMDTQQDQIMSDDLANCMSYHEQNQKQDHKAEEQVKDAQSNFKQSSTKNSQLKEGILESKERQLGPELKVKYSLGEKVGSDSNKKSQVKAEIKSMLHSNKSSKYSVGSKLPDGSIVRAIIEEEWEFIRKDNARNKYYQCKKCKKEIRADHRRIHACKA